MADSTELEQRVRRPLLRHAAFVLGILALTGVWVLGKGSCQFRSSPGEIQGLHATASSVVLVDQWDANVDPDSLAEPRTRLIRFDLVTGEEQERIDLGVPLECGPAHEGHLWCSGEALQLIRLDDLEIVADASTFYGEDGLLGPEAPRGDHLRYLDGAMYLRAVDGRWHLIDGATLEPTPTPTSAVPTEGLIRRSRAGVSTRDEPEGVAFLEPERLQVRSEDLPLVLYVESLAKGAPPKLRHDAGPVIELTAPVEIEAYATTPQGDHLVALTEAGEPTMLRIGGDGTLVWRVQP